MFIVVLDTPSGRCYLRRTIWTFQGRRERAEEFATEDAARAQLDKARPFMKAANYKAARILPAESSN